MKNAIKHYFRYSPFLSFIPIAVFYMLIVLKFHSDSMQGDEDRYVQFAENILKGFYSPPAPDINLWNGPGYPIIIAPLVGLKLPLICITLLNAIFQYLSVVLLFLTLRRYVSLNTTIIVSCFWAFYYNAYLWEMPCILTEPLTCFLVSAICYFSSKTFSTERLNFKNLSITGFLIGYLVLTKIIFGYVLLCLLLGAICYYFLKKSAYSKKILMCFVVAFFVNVPYLVYTYSLTNKFLYWGNSGGMSLYCMSTPYKEEYGDWHDLFAKSMSNNMPLIKNHQKDIEYLSNYNGVALDDAYKKLAIENIKAHPLKYLRNCLANVCRFLFDTPYYFATPTDYYLLRILPTCILLPFIILSILLILINFSKTRIELKILFFLTILYFVFTTLVSSYSRQFYIMVPVFALLIAYCLEKSIKLKLKF